ncbi:MAG: glycosyltransferase family 1 protein [Vicinamibacterales bacterium]
MRVAIDARELCGKPTGVGRYLAGLLREWTSTGTAGHEFLLYGHRHPTDPIDAAIRVVPGAGGTLWEQRELPRALARDGVDVLFSPAYSTPLVTRVPRVVAMHDISFEARPDWYRWREGVRRRLLARLSVRAARAVVTISEFSRGEIVSRLGVAPSKVHVVPPGVDNPLADADMQSERSAPHVLYVGFIFNRRNIPDLVAAFSTLAARHGDAQLHIVGDNRSHPFIDVTAVIACAPAADRIHWHRYVPEAQLRQLYRDSRAFAFLSEYQGLGLTPLEALSAGIPSVLLDTPVARESCGASALYVDLHDTGATAAAIERLLYDAPTRERLLADAPGVLRRYDWTTAARETLALLDGAA